MEQKIQLKHPAGKKAVRMNKEKYDVIAESVLNCLQLKGELTHTEILKELTDDFKKNRTLFEGSIEWHLEWVKLDLEAGKKISRLAETTPIKFKLSGQ